MKRFLTLLITLFFSILLQSQCWLNQGVQDLADANVSTEFKTSFKTGKNVDSYKLLYEQAFDLRNNLQILNKLSDNFKNVLSDLKNVNEDFLNSQVIHLDLGGHNRYPDAIKIITADVDYADNPITNLLDGRIQDYTLKFDANSVDRITIENSPYSDDILEEVNRVTKDGASIELEHFSDEIADYNVIAEKVGGSVTKTETFIKEGFEYTRATIIKGLKSTSELESSIISNLKSRGLSDSIIEDILIHSMYIDDVLGFKRMSSIIEKLVGHSEFKNHDDLIDNLKSVFSNDNVNTLGAENLIKEFEEGKYWIDQGNEVYISKKWSSNSDEVDVTIITKKALVECKNVIGGIDAVKANINLIISKYSTPSKLSNSLKLSYPNHYGKISISNSNNPYYNLTKSEFMDKVKSELLDVIGGVDKYSLKTYINKLYIENDKGRFIVDNSEW